MTLYEERFLKGNLESDTSAIRKAAVTKLRRQNPTFNVFQSQRRGIAIRDVEKAPDFCYNWEMVDDVMQGMLNEEKGSRSKTASNANNSSLDIQPENDALAKLEKMRRVRR